MNLISRFDIPCGFISRFYIRLQFFRTTKSSLHLSKLQLIEPMASPHKCNSVRDMGIANLIIG